MIKFITETEEKSVTFAFCEVSENQFFVNADGELCQRASDDSYLVIADSNGNPYATWHEDVDENEEITRIIEHISKIQF